MSNLVTDYGAVADAQWAVPTISITSGTTALSASTAVWTHGVDEGKHISVGGANGGNALATTISAVALDGKSVTLAGNSPSTVTAEAHLVIWAATDNATAFSNFRAASQGATTALTIPPGVYYSSALTPAAMWDGIADLTVNMTGATLAVGTAIFGAISLFQDNAHSARTATALKGDVSIILKTPSQVSLFSVGQRVLMAGLDLFGFGFPCAPHFLEFPLITAIDSNTMSPTYGKINFSEPLKNSYLSTWPLYNAGSSGEIDCGGPATLYALNPHWDCTIVHNGGTIVQDSQIGAPGRDITFNGTSFPIAHGNLNQGPFPSVNEFWTLSDCIVAGTMEFDKCVGKAAISGGSVQTINVQTSSVNALLLDDVTLTGFLVGTPKVVVANDVVFTSDALFGATVAGRGDEATFNFCAFARLGSGSNFPGGVLDKGGAGDPGFNLSAGVSMSGGVITSPNSRGPVPWAIPGTHCFWSDPNMWVETHFQVLSITQDATNTYIQTDLPGGFLVPPFGATKIWIYVHPAPKITFNNCAGAEPQISSLNQAPAGAPLFSAQTYTYTSGVAKAAAQPPFETVGKLIRLSINVTHAYGGAGALTFSPGSAIPVIQSADNSELQYSPVVNAKISGERVITPGRVVGAQSGDTGLSLSDAAPWFAGFPAGGGPAFSSDVSGADPGVTVVVTAQTDQGVSRAFICRFE